LPDFSILRKSLKDENEGPFSSVRSVLGGQGDKTHPDVDEIIITYYLKQSTEQLKDSLDWFSVNAPRAYKVLAFDRFSSFERELRSDLANGFERIKENSLLQLKTQFGSDWEKIYDSWKQFDDFTRSQFIEAAFFGLAKNPRQGDAEIARPYLEQTYGTLLDCAVDIIAKVGNSDDVPALITVTQNAYGPVRKSAASAALKLSTDPVPIARDFLLNGSSESYYYNVVTWLDRLLYSPLPLRLAYAEKLERMALKSGL
jgi:hypothetical protein